MAGLLIGVDRPVLRAETRAVATRMHKTQITSCILAALLVLPAAAQAQFNFTTNDGAITITGYTGPGGAVVIPSSTNGLPVTSIGDYAFYICPNLTSITIPSSVTSIGLSAFAAC